MTQDNLDPMATPIRSAVVAIETPDSFVLQRRPDLPGKLAYPGKLQFLGGHANDGEPLKDAAARELGEETDLEISKLDIQPVWEGEYEGEDSAGQPINRYVGLFKTVIDSADSIHLKERGELVNIPNTQEGVRAYEAELTPFALTALQKITGE